MGIRFLKFIIIILLQLFFSSFLYGTDIITSSQNLSDGRTLVSSDGSFELGFFSPGNSGKSRYLGIWYKNIPVQNVVWVANRCNPINDSSGVLMINNTGNLVLLNQSGSVIWASNSKKEAQNPEVQLLDSGNLVLQDRIDGNPATPLWQSFDYPTDSWLPGMKFGWDLSTGLNRRLSAWNSPDDPCPGDLTYGIELYNLPDLVMRKGSRKYFRTGNWKGGVANQFFTPNSIANEQEIYLIYHTKSKSVITRLVLNQTTGGARRIIWNEEARTWTVYSQFPSDDCDNYGTCGAYGNCVNTEIPPCQCLKGFKQKSQELNSVDWSQGCVRNNPLDCQKGDGFKKFGGLKLPDAEHSWVNESMDLDDCRDKCLENCSCTAYTILDIKEDRGCVIWFADLIDLKLFPPAAQDLYIRMSVADSDHEETKSNNKLKAALIIAAAILVVVSVVVITYYIRRSNRSIEEREIDRSNARQNEDLELPFFEFVFKNEVALIAKLQHRNLVKLLGCCIQGEEKMLIYEYMPNKSLDYFIFDDTRRNLLDWSRRFHIICGIARGLLYLHQDSRLRIIHRDIKASNVLLDNEMNPKISDFGLARTFGEQSDGKTNRVVGTYGYMAPEYAINGQFSIKSDVFSFGILLLEIISGKRNRGFYHLSDNINLIGHAWRLWKEGHPLELIDSFGKESCTLSEVLRCIHIGLLCVQQHSKDRPSMSSVVVMLSSETELVQPKEPSFLSNEKFPEINPLFTKPESSSTNEHSFSVLEPR
ncbi:hypothetical protein SLEP1_g30067 [Rubroshorea leprosula]|uniref:Receptor-like serine/threonine-protein kinase n=1 Tax=Rubroshorea leprosula TaxID=152421 RepID=A0AAV5JYX1_9ROSI|nr:hypothetical protein SLEP1_g30067 [Rubroshorea leprosula]